MTIIKELEEEYLKKDLPEFNPGDTVRVFIRIIEGTKERIQSFEGIVIRKQGSGISECFTVYRHAYGSGMDRLFLLHSPRIQKIEVLKRGKVRRAKLNYLRGKTGKKARVKEKIHKKVVKLKKEVTSQESIQAKEEPTTVKQEKPEDLNPQT